MDYNDIEMSDLTGEQLDLAECIGLEAYRLLVSTYGGNNVYIAKADMILREKRDKKIKSEYNGYNIRPLSIKYNLAEKTIRSIVSSENKRVKNEPAENQIPLF